MSPAVTGRDRTGYFRWVICGLLFLASTVNYIDRQVIGILKPTLQQEFGWTEMDYADIVFAFQLAYAVGFLFAGRMIDWLGTKKGFTVALVVWSLAAIAHAEVTVFGATAAPIRSWWAGPTRRRSSDSSSRGLRSDLAKRATFPPSIKIVAEWFPTQERALATGLFNSGTNIGAVVTPIVVPWITLYLGVVLGVRRHGSHGLPVAGVLDPDLPCTRGPSLAWGG